MGNPHLIRTLKFDLDIPSKSKNTVVQNKIVGVFHTQFTAMLEEVFDRYGKEEQIVIDSLSLQLGPIQIDQLEKSVVHQSREQLIQYFEKYKTKKKYGNRASKAAVDDHSDDLHPVLFYILHGVYPWNVTDPKPFRTAWKNALGGKRFLAQLREVAWSPNAVDRLIYQLDEALLQETIHCLIGADSADVREYHERLFAFVDEGKRLKKTSSKEFRQRTWACTLNCLLTLNKVFSMSAFVDGHLKQLISNDKVGSRELVPRLSKELKKTRLSHAKAEDPLQMFEIAKDWFNIRSASKRLVFDEAPIEQLETLLVRKKKTNKEMTTLKRWIVHPKNRKSIQGSWIGPLRENLLEMVVTVLEPAYSSAICAYQHGLWKLHAKEAITSSFESYKKTIWSLTFDYLTTSFSSVFQAKEFLRYHIKKLSNKYHIDQLVLVQNLLANYRSHHGFGTKYEEFILLLNLLAKENTPPVSKTGKVNQKPTKKDWNIDELKTIPKNKGRTTYEQTILIKKWLLNPNNRNYIWKYWIHSFDEKRLNQFIEIIIPEQRFFIQQYLGAVNKLFAFMGQTDNVSIRFKKSCYLLVFEYILRSDFQKNAFVAIQIKGLLTFFKLNENEFRNGLHNYLSANKGAQIKHSQVLSLFNDLAPKKTNKFDGNIPFSITRNSNLDQLWKFLEEGKLDSRRTVSSKSSFQGPYSLEQFQTALEYVIANEPKQWFEVVQKQGRPPQIDRTLENKLSISMRTAINFFEINYRKWVAVESNLLQYAKQSLTIPEIAFFFFLEEGFLPQWESRKTMRSIAHNGLTENTVAILLNYTWSPRSLQHWTYDMEHEEKLDFLKKLSKGGSDHFTFQLYSNLFGIYSSVCADKRPPTFAHFEMSFWEVLFFTGKGNTPILSFSFVEKMLRLWKERFRLTFDENGAFQEVVKLNANRTGQLPGKKNVQSAVVVRPKKLLSDKITKTPAFGNDMKNREQITRSWAPGPLKMDDGLTKWLVGNAGLVLVHPFLIHLFGLVDYLNEKKQFKNTNLQFRAVYLLHYIATGLTDHIHEIELVVSKILCGMSVGQAVPSDIVLTKEEMDFSNDLLQMLISRWEKLGKTSSEGLRNTFLVRNGLLEKKEAAYQLTIETSGTDILLDFIPWNISIVQLPWLEHIIYISWR